MLTYRDPPNQMNEKDTERNLLSKIQRREDQSHALRPLWS